MSSYIFQNFKEERLMAFWELVILILVASLVSMIEICVILAAVSKMIDAKTDAKIKMATALFRNEMEYMEKLFDKYFKELGEMIDKIVNGKKQPEYITYSKNNVDE